ncbi:hypothetical protein BASA83_010367 [Batrachochytrium salamandrivorans]|nr:hypothetical protein BASA83_010367 [Batrachochytrium salamandrivorans]
MHPHTRFHSASLQTLKPPPIETHYLPLSLFILTAAGIAAAINVSILRDMNDPNRIPALKTYEFCHAKVTSTTLESPDTCRVHLQVDAERNLPSDTGIFHICCQRRLCQIARQYTSHCLRSCPYRAAGPSLRPWDCEQAYSCHENRRLASDSWALDIVPIYIQLGDHIVMIAGGTGIAPMYQLIRRILENPEDKTTLCLVYASRDERNILLKSELDLLQSVHPERLCIRYQVDSCVGPMPANIHVGALDASQLTALLPASSGAESIKVLVSGPEGMVNAIAGQRQSLIKQGPVGGILRSVGLH